MTVFKAIFESRRGKSYSGQVRRITKRVAYLLAHEVPQQMEDGQLHIRLPARHSATTHVVVNAEVRVGAVLVSGNSLQAELKIVEWGANHERLFDRLNSYSEQ